MAKEFPQSICLQGKEYPIHTDFRYVFRWIKLTRRKDLTDQEKMIGTVFLFCKDAIPAFAFGEAYQAIASFILCKKPMREEEQGERCIDFQQDYYQIWSGFRSELGVDLETERIHWWKFRTLFDELSQEAQIKQIARIRTMPIDLKAPPEELHRILMAKEEYRLWEEGENE